MDRLDCVHMLEHSCADTIIKSSFGFFFFTDAHNFLRNLGLKFLVIAFNPKFNIFRKFGQHQFNHFSVIHVLKKKKMPSTYIFSIIFFALT